MKIREELEAEVDLLRRWVRTSGRDVIATTRESLVSVEGRTGAWVLAGLWALGRLQIGPWRVWGQDLGGDILPAVRSWYAGEMVLFQAGLLLAHAGVGVLWGVVIKNAWGFVGRAWPRAGTDRFRPWVVSAITGLAVLLLHGGLLLRDLLRHPALYQETFLDRGGLAAWVHRFALERMSGIFGIVLLLLTGGIVSAAVLRILHRLVLWFLNFSRPTRVAIGVLGGALAVFAGGLRFVLWTQATHNEGPNLVLITVDGLRGDALGLGPAERLVGPAGAGQQDPRALAWFRRNAQVRGRTVPPSLDLSPVLATAFTGRSPLSHGIRHDFPSAQESDGGAASLPGLLRENGWWTSALADGPADYLDRVRNSFDAARVAPGDLLSRVARRELERSPHLLPYLSGRGGRCLPLLRGSPFLADPALLAREAGDLLGGMEGKQKFFLWIHFSSPGPLSTAASPRASAQLARAGFMLFRRPGDGGEARPLTDAEWIGVRRLYDQNITDVQEAVEDVLRQLTRRGMDKTTTVLLWSPRAALLSARDEADARSLKGPAFFDLPFWAVSPTYRSVGRRLAGPARAVDVAPTAVHLLGLAVPPEWEGAPLTDGLPAGEAGLLYAESPTFFHKDGPVPAVSPASLDGFLEEDRDSPGHLRLSPAWEDPVLLFRNRFIQLGDERLVYRPGPSGVSFEYFDVKQDLLAVRDLSATRPGKARVKELREIFYRAMAREAGWRPQNDYWIPEAFLREEPIEETHGQ